MDAFVLLPVSIDRLEGLNAITMPGLLHLD